ncbi:hypothetical protein Acid345_3526 [Candidatus Koribacter versatilis Ellin345]|uniref:DUF5666 domain-containing protein n=1 Tax=Koribacter versatilis (strain Ellin345) TaxID=204669 RepID=Q1IKS3_KORVE|nr:DUF5666 domain-containing protein [Candidatus Koribacter versatilis]ABF42527.1 hypothetical protein Acid345_3526 [Candidatus Koribacter versatilis Ellin345]
MKNWFLVFLISVGFAVAQDAATANTKAVGTVQSISGSTFTLKNDAGVETSITVSDATKVLRSEPGQKSLKEATPVQFSEAQVGDRALASGKASADGKSIAASTVVLMKKGDIANKQEQERQDWQRRSVGGLVSAVDANAGTITLSMMAAGGQKKDVVVHTTPTTVVRRYSPDSVKFDDATKSTLAEVKKGDQLRARGNKNADGTDIAAEEIVSGSFRSVAGTVQSVDKEKNRVTVTDLATKKPVTVTIASDSQMRKLPEMMAQRIAARLKGTPTAGAAAGAPGAAATTGAPGAAGQGARQPGAGGEQSAQGGQGNWAGGQGGGARGGGGDMLQQVLNRAPVVQLTDLQKGDAVMIVATEGSANSAPTVITLLSGVDPILSASPKGGDTSTILSPWNLGGSGGGGDLAQ